MRVKVKGLVESDFEAGLESGGVTGGNVGLAAGGNLLVGDDHVHVDAPLAHARDEVFDGGCHGVVAQGVVVGVALPGESEAPAVEVRAALPGAFAGVPGAFGVSAEHGAAAVAGDEDVVAHFTCGVAYPGDTTTVASV